MQALTPLSHPAEMESDINQLVDKLKADIFYKEKFHYVYADKLVSGERILKVLLQFQFTLVSSNSKYDKVKTGQEVFLEKTIYTRRLQKRTI